MICASGWQDQVAAMDKELAGVAARVAADPSLDEAELVAEVQARFQAEFEGRGAELSAAKDRLHESVDAEVAAVRSTLEKELQVAQVQLARSIDGWVGGGVGG